MRANPTIPPAAPPAIAAVFDLEADVVVLSTAGPATLPVGALPGSEVEVEELCAAEATGSTPGERFVGSVNPGGHDVLLAAGIEKSAAARKWPSLEFSKSRKAWVRFPLGQP